MWKICHQNRCTIVPGKPGRPGRTQSTFLIQMSRAQTPTLRFFITLWIRAQPTPLFSVEFLSHTGFGLYNITFFETMRCGRLRSRCWWMRSWCQSLIYETTSTAATLYAASFATTCKIFGFGIEFWGGDWWRWKKTASPPSIGKLMSSRRNSSSLS